MHIADILGQRRPVFSFEFFPPKTEEGQRTLGMTLGQLEGDRPDFVSMTYGAGGSTRNATVDLTRWIKQDLGIEAMAHLSCVGEPTERLLEILGQIEESGLENVLALRGDPPRGETEWTPHPGGLNYSVELIRLIVERYDFCVGAACFPEVHPDAPDRESDLRFSKPLEKERLGLGRWTAMFLGLFGSYGKNDTVDVQYRLAGRDVSATGLEIIPPDEP